MGISELMRLGISIRDADVKETIRASGPEASEEEVGPLITAVLGGGLVGSTCGLSWWATREDEGFVAYSKGSKRPGTKVSKFITDLIVL